MIKPVWIIGVVVLLCVVGCSVVADTSGTHYKCSATEACPPGFECEFGSCVSSDPADCAPIFADDFDDSERSMQWAVVETGATASQADGVLVLAPAAATVESEASYQTTQRFNISERRLVVEVPGMLNVGSGEGANMIVNGDFSAADITPWQLNTSGTGVGAATIEAGELRLAITDGGMSGSSVQLVQTGLQLEQGVTYVVRFDARAPAPRSVEVNVNLGVVPFTLFGEQPFMLTTSLERYSFEFVMAEPTETDARLDLNVGTSTINVFVDNVVVARKANTNDTGLALVRVGDVASSEYLFIAQQGGRLAVGQHTPADVSVIAALDYDPVAQRFWQLREQDSTTYFETSEDGDIWTTHASVPTPVNAAGAVVDLSASADDVTSDPGQLSLDNVRLLPVECP